MFTFIFIAFLLLLATPLVYLLVLYCSVEEKHPFEALNISLPNKLIGHVMSIKYYKVCLQMKMANIPDDISNLIKVYLRFNRGPRYTDKMSKLVALMAKDKGAIPFIREAIEKRLK